MLDSVEPYAFIFVYRYYWNSTGTGHIMSLGFFENSSLFDNNIQ